LTSSNLMNAGTIKSNTLA